MIKWSKSIKTTVTQPNIFYFGDSLTDRSIVLTTTPTSSIDNGPKFKVQRLCAYTLGNLRGLCPKRREVITRKPIDVENVFYGFYYFYKKRVF